MYDIVVIGAGVVGGMIARELTRYQLSVCIIEKQRDVAMGASKANSGIVHAGFDAKEGSLKALLNVRGSEMMADVAKELGVHYKNNGSLVVGFTDEDIQAINGLYERGVKNGVKNLRVLSKEEVKALEPNISDNVIGALHAPTGGIVCPYMLTVASVGNAMDNGAVLKTDFEVTSIEYTNGVYKVSSPTETVEAAYVINAAGVYSDKIAAMAGYGSFTVTPRKGEYMLLDRECGNLVSHTIFKVPTKMGKGILVSPTVDGNLLLGPTSVNIEDKDNVETTKEGIDAIVAGSTVCVDGIPLRSVITSFTGLRAVGDTGDFIIEAAGDHFVNVGGIESPGLSSAPAIAVYVTDLLAKMGMELKKNENFCPTRKIFRAAESKYHKVICRCETISEGEILTAIHTNPGAKDIDGIKRRTRSGMGRCQGGFCMPYVADILARELGTSLLDVTKFGGKSNLLVGKVKEVQA
ncbi:MAG: FAD-dependent oxidoreductase [Clostridia bacterium]|nr:FAD-dependent oxidoreductase [Clostridia bacterium]